MNIINKYCDHVFVITIEISDRQENIKTQLNDVDYEIFYGVDGSKFPTDFYDNYLNNRKPDSHLLSRGMLGCTLSHIELYKKIYQEKLNNVLILEDDLFITNNIDNLDLYFENLNNFDLLYFGLNNTHLNYDNYLEPNIGNHLVEITSDLIRNRHPLEGTNAYMIKDFNFAKKISDFNSENLFTPDGAITEYMKKKNDINCYLFHPQVILQNGDSLIYKINSKFEY